MQTFLAITQKKETCRVLGPGKRSVIWFHGCSKKCPWCIASEINQSRDYSIITAKNLYEWVAECKDIEGITLSGGEPLEQDTSAMCEFLQLVRNDSRNLGIILFTGYRLEELEHIGKMEVCRYIDVLIDGPYIEEQNNGHGLRGSSNQRIHFLTSRYKIIQDAFYKNNQRNLEFDIDIDNNVIISGIPKRGFIKEFTNKIHEQGYNISFNNRINKS